MGGFMGFSPRRRHPFSLDMGHMEAQMKTFQMPDIRLISELYPDPSAIHRHYLVIRDAMRADDKHKVGNRQLRLLNGGFEIPVTLEQCNKLLEKYKDDS
jgi:hypothetical protein